ncbi:hypothetical protein [Geodermatophilus maliterrae]|uniref:Uncharacterized protein n=1 Tax=Geodermatophilus maliterrae TaxID=3162531 RepID=A0ABV3XA28_9ACTN
MGDQSTPRGGLSSQLDHAEERYHLEVLSDAIWDLEGQLAQVKAQRAELMNSLQADRRSSRR